MQHGFMQKGAEMSEFRVYAKQIDEMAKKSFSEYSKKEEVLGEIKPVQKRMKEGGIKGILNFSPAILGDKDIAVRNVHFAEELRFLTAMIPDLEKGV